ncbi:opioid growth factor receptor conserved region-domain-containing protein [Naematelia encephala]|uniref:Opioid growth factor receptor conserved region-domain-containing protein n=1 Tax=Naematelia encephala TaxID=71784 RepID=A0A1Y2BIE5_9TREE|nr:opioid growth factor receptor conserved region-domain-containing protein [Naematelia encephala]
MSSGIRTTAFITRRIRPLRPLASTFPTATRSSYIQLQARRDIRDLSVMPSARPRDVEDFLASYPGQSNQKGSDVNLRFYSNEIRMRPDDMTYEEFMHAYERDWDELESNHGFIQWLFPIRESGVNPLSRPLQVTEAKAMSENSAILTRLLRSYKMMLLFYGIEFNEGKLQPSSEARKRLRNLQYNPHNLLRLTRILKHLSEITPLQPHAAVLVLYMTAQHSEGFFDLSSGTMAGDSLERWWGNCFRDEEERKQVRKIIMDRGKLGARQWGFREFGEWYDARESRGWVG